MSAHSLIFPSVCKHTPVHWSSCWPET